MYTAGAAGAAGARDNPYQDAHTGVEVLVVRQALGRHDRVKPENKIQPGTPWHRVELQDASGSH